MKTSGEYALLHANGMSFADVVAAIRAEVVEHYAYDDCRTTVTNGTVTFPVTSCIVAPCENCGMCPDPNCGDCDCAVPPNAVQESFR